MPRENNKTSNAIFVWGRSLTVYWTKKARQYFRPIHKIKPYIGRKKATLRARLRVALKFLKLTAFVNEILWWMPGTPSHGVDAPAAGHSFAYACAYCTRVLLKRLLTHCQTPRRGFSSHTQNKIAYWTKKKPHFAQGFVWH